MTKPRGDAAEESRRQLIANLDRFRGAEALYREGQRVSRVQVSEIEPGDAGIRARVTLLPSRGLYNKRDATWTIYSSWDTFGCTEEHWSSAYISLTIYFDRALVESVVRLCDSAIREEYDAKRFEDIGRWIRSYRKAALVRRLTPEIKLFFQEQFLGTVAEHLPQDYPEVRSKFFAADMSSEVKSALVEYARWRSSDINDGFDGVVEDFFTGWRLETTDGVRLKITPPLVDFDAATIQWKYAGRTGELA